MRRLLSECSEWSLIPRERGRLTALDKLAPDGRTDWHCDTLSSCRSQKWTAIYSYFWVVVVVHKVLFSASVPKGLLGLHLIGFGTGIGTRLDNYFPSNILNLIHRAESHGLENLRWNVVGNIYHLSWLTSSIIWRWWPGNVIFVKGRRLLSALAEVSTMRQEAVTSSCVWRIVKP